MRHKKEISSQKSSTTKPTSLNLQTRPFAMPEVQEKTEDNKQEQGFGEEISFSGNLLEKLISSPQSNSDIAIQRKPKKHFASIIEAKVPIQAKLSIGEPNDKYEKEADETAEAVVDTISAPSKQPTASSLSMGAETIDLESQELIARSTTDAEPQPIQQKSINQNLLSGSVQRQIQSRISTIPQKPFIQKTEDHAKQIASLYDPEGIYKDWESISKAKENFLPYQWDIILAAVNLDESGKPQLWDRLGNKVDESPLNEAEQAALDKKMEELDRLDEEIDLEDLEEGLKGIHKNILLYLEGTIRDRLGNGGVAQFYKGAHIILKDNGAVYEEVKRLGMPIAALKENGDIKSKTEFVGKTGTNYGGFGSDTAEQRSGKMFTRRPENSETSHYQPNVVDNKDKPLPNKDQGWGYGWGLRGTYYEKKNIGYDSNVDTVKPQLGIDLPESVKGHILVGIVPPHLGDESKNDAVGHTFVQTEGAGFQNFNEASLAHGQGFLANVGVTAKKGTQTGLVGKTLHSEKTTQADLDKNSDARAEIREQDQHPLEWDWDTLYSEALEYALQHSEVY
ncbi:hypothetical protein [Pseudanabaena sp. ABRG5-3]|uniref:hypothetical protein n=1 Tax=Pseudanabaena sp. ABRG5-3 TaxID=685565 RepID=UPI000DC6E0D0|nr:hypothetical protein [Pseudanabaena sp. ABRG5-3]BBC27048.1 hypothetical protein ABRG53_d083 [Pseudanabaena sp. ABRG5-3]